MKHFGDITKINGAEVPIVDIICGGSPCQDLSTAGHRKGIRHGELGDDETTRSGLFMDQIRIIKEMHNECRRTNKPIRPRYMVFENVTGLFSSNGGEDFRIVLEETARVSQCDTIIPRLAEGDTWSNAGTIMADGWSLAWKIHNSEYWGIPQRRCRVSLIADFGGTSAPEVLFERESLSGNLEPSGEIGKTSSDITSKSFGRNFETISFQERAGCEGGGKGILIQDNKIGTLSVSDIHRICYDEGKVVSFGFDQGTSRDIGKLFLKERSKSLVNGTNPGFHNAVVIYEKEKEDFINPIVRRLTPLECERLQGFPDGWTDIGEWTDNTGKTRSTSDRLRFKSLGNSLCLPFWDWLAGRITDELKAEGSRDLTMASLFDGIGGFPLVFSRHGCVPVWASEIEDFPIAVTKYHFPEREERKEE